MTTHDSPDTNSGLGNDIFSTLTKENVIFGWEDLFGIIILELIFSL